MPPPRMNNVVLTQGAFSQPVQDGPWNSPLPLPNYEGIMVRHRSASEPSVKEATVAYCCLLENSESMVKRRDRVLYVLSTYYV